MTTDEGIFFDIVPEPEGNNRIYVNFYNSGCFSIEVSREELVQLREQLGKFLDFRPYKPETDFKPHNSGARYSPGKTMEGFQLDNDLRRSNARLDPVGRDCD